MNKLQPDKIQGSDIQINSLSKYKDVLNVFQRLVSPMRGPHGKISMLQNTSGGNLVLTSSSRLFLQSLSVDKSVIRLIVSACQSHMSTFQDGGLFLMGLTAKLIIEGLESDLNPVFLSDIFEVFLTMTLEYLNSSNCPIKIRACLSDLPFISSVVNTILKSKSLCLLEDPSLQHIRRLLIECFLSSVDEEDSSSSQSVYIQCVEGKNVLESFIKQGILIPAPELSRFREKTVEIKHCKLDGIDIIKVAMVTVSMSGDMDELSGVKYTVTDSVDFDDVVVDGLAEFCDNLIGGEVGLVLCQKVVHPELKYRLHSAGVMVVDRIGSQSIGYIQSLTGAVPIQCLDASQSLETMFGRLSIVSHQIIHGKSYLLLKKEDSPIVTLHLCHQQEENLNELKDVCSTVLVSLRHLLYEPYVVPGAGCWQALLAAYLAKQVKENIKTLCMELGCSELSLTSSCSMFIKCLMKVCTTQNTRYSVSSENGHLYYRDELKDESYENFCCCGLEERTETDVFHDLDDRHELGLHDLHSGAFPREITKDFVLDRLKSREIIMDGYSMCRSALQASVLTAVSVLRIGQVIEETA